MESSRVIPESVVSRGQRRMHGPGYSKPNRRKEQSCILGMRFFVVSSIFTRYYNHYMSDSLNKLSNLKLDPATNVVSVVAMTKYKLPFSI